MRKLSITQGRFEIEWVLVKYLDKLRTHKVRGIIDNILWVVSAGDGVECANALILQYDLQYPSGGSHEYFDDGVDRLPVIHLDPNFTIPDEDRIFPGQKNHPGKMRYKEIVKENIATQLEKFEDPRRF